MQIPIDELSLFFPCHNESENLVALVDEALTALPALAHTYEVILVDDGSTDATPEVAARIVAAHPRHVRVIRHDVNRGYGGALRSGIAATRFPWLAFTDGDCQFRVADLARLIVRASDEQTVVAGYRIQRADPPLRALYAGLYRVANRVLFGLVLRDVDCAAKLFPRESLRGLTVQSNGAFFSAELMIQLQSRGVRFVEVGMPHFPRVAGSASGARGAVIFAAIRDFWSLRLALWFRRSVVIRRGDPLL